MTRFPRHPLLAGFDRKLARAKAQQAKICRDVTTYLESKVWRFGHVIEDGFIKVRVESFGERYAPDNWALETSECAHNLRSALDNLTYAASCAKKFPPDRPAALNFPICDKKENFDAWWKKVESEYVGGSDAIFERLQPYCVQTAAPSPASALRDYSNSDKHRIAPRVALWTSVIKPRIEVVDQEAVDFAQRFKCFGWSGPIDSGNPILEVTVNSAQALKWDGSFEASFDIGIEVSNRNVVPIRKFLNESAAFVEEAGREMGLFFAIDQHRQLDTLMQSALAKIDELNDANS